MDDVHAQRGEPRAAAATQGLRADDELSSAALAVSSARSEAVFPELVRYLATLLKVEVAFIALVHAEDSAKLQMLAFWLDGQIRENFSYPMAGTPCETVVREGYSAYPQELTRLFPLDNDFASLGVESYAGFPLTDGRGKTLGIMSVVSRQPMRDPQRVHSILQIFAVRAAAELERLHAEEVLRASEASYRAIFEAAEDAIFIHDWDTAAVVDVNPKACETYGYSHDEMHHITITELSSGVPPYTGEEALRRIAEAKLGRTVRFEWQRRNKDGSLHWDEVRLKTAVIGGKPRIVAFTREITERKLAEEALRASEEQYRAIFDASADALVLWNSELQRVDINPAYERIYGFSRDEVLSGAHMEGQPLEYAEQRRELVRRTLAGEPCSVELESVRKHGARIQVEVRTIPIHHRGQPHVLAISRDITERKRAEEERVRLEAQLQQAQKMEAIGQLTGGIAHDFNNILTSILGYVVLAGERSADLGDDRLGHYLDQAQRASQRARDLIQQMLVFSRGQRGEPQTLMLAPLVRDSLQLLRSTVPSTIMLQTDLDDGAPAVMVDPVQMEQVLFNLCINARDALNGTGEIRVSVRVADYSNVVCASCRESVRGRFIELAVRDTGPGIAPEVMNRIFEPFFSTKEVGRGSGMGLSMVHGIVHEHGGHILIDTENDRGTVFKICLAPTASAAQAANPSDRLRAGASRRQRRLAGRVLVVEDERMVGEYMAELLGGWGLNATVIPDPLEARAWFARDPSRVDAVVTDQTMPRMTGLALARELADARPTLPVILYTGYGDTISDEELRACGACALLKKPVEPNALFELLQRHLPQQPSAEVPAR